LSEENELQETPLQQEQKEKKELDTQSTNKPMVDITKEKGEDNLDVEPLPILEERNGWIYIDGEAIFEQPDLKDKEKALKTYKKLEKYCKENYNDPKPILYYIASLTLPAIPLPSERIDILLEIDQKIQRLVEGRIWYVKNYSSDEQAEADLLLRLASYDLDAWEIATIMNMAPYRWQERRLQEKIQLINEAIANATINPMSNWLNLTPKRVIIYPGSETYIEIHLENEKIKLKGEEILTAKKFREQYFAQGKLLPPLDNKTWCNLVNMWCLEKGLIDKARREDLSPEQEAVETVVEYIESSRPVAKKVQAFTYGFFYYDEKENAILVPSERIRDLLDNKNIRIDLRKLAYHMKDYIKSGTKVIKVESGKTKRFWIFDATKFDVDLEHIVDLESIEEDNREVGE